MKNKNFVNIKNIHICEDCKGKGYEFKPIYLISFVGLKYPMCPNCLGKGFIIKDNNE